MVYPKAVSFLAAPITAAVVGIIAWVRHPFTFHQAIAWLVAHPVWCVVGGMSFGLLMTISLIAGFTFQEKLNGGQPESENSLANQIARELQDDLNGIPWWARRRYRWW